ncbi:MAG: response regulator [Synergistaceae bacterium]|jgi:putative two-component system response regulator|nr:response regulator [Synergistaceae bacterium]
MLKTIMVVDDNLVNLRYIEGQLSGHYRVILAKSGEQALSICARERPDIILLDIEMPVMDGFETIARLKRDMVLSNIPVIFLTAHHDTATEVKGLESGAVDFITKPFEKSILLHRLALHILFAEYQRKLENTVKELSDSLSSSFAALVECRDANTGGHIVRSSRYVAMLGRELQRRDQFREELSDFQLDMMVRAAPLHDIGKVSVSDLILLKPAKLDEKEFEVMKSHTTLGARIIKSMYDRTPTQRYLRYATMIAEWHHEKYDGTGYPERLAGDDIPLCAKIMAVADVYDALVDDRVYRKALSHREAFDIIMNGKGSHFDPRVVDAFETVSDEMEAESKKSVTVSNLAASEDRPLARI